MNLKKMDIRKIITIVVIIGWQLQVMMILWISVSVDVLHQELLLLSFNSIQSVVQLVIIFYYKKESDEDLTKKKEL